jgi:O-antigen ligase
MGVLKKAYELLFIVGIFIIPFNSFSYRIPAMGEFSRESAIIFLLLGTVCFFLHTIITKKFYLPKGSLLFKIILVFMGWCIIATLLNFNYLFDSMYKTIFGYERFFRQFIGLLLSVVLFIFYYNVLHDKTNRQILKFIRGIFTVSFIIVSIYGVIEIAIVRFNASFLNPVIELFNYFPFVEVWVDVNHGRISSVTFEPPTLAMYLITVAGWMFSYILTNKDWWKWIPGIMVIILAYYSKSRTAQAVILVQLAAFIYFYIKHNQIPLKTTLRAASLGVVAMFIAFLSFSSIRTSLKDSIDGFNFKKNLASNVSNQSRLGIQAAAFEVFKNNPTYGVGYGQAAYHMRPLFPDWATRGNYEFRIFYYNQKLLAFPPIYNWYTRLLAETGIIGLLLFLCFSIWLFYTLWMSYLQNKIDGDNILQIILLISFIGFFINWLQVDTPRVFGFWLCLAIVMPRSKLLND